MRNFKAFAVVASLALGVAVVAAGGAAHRVGTRVVDRPAASVLQSRTALLFDPTTKRTIRRTYRVWNRSPEPNLDFEWRPDDLANAPSGLAAGRGTLVWRQAGAATFDAAAVVSVYRGEMRNGDANGNGVYRHRDGEHYEGLWRNGLYEGAGRLEVADGATYEGAFKSGHFHGEGRFASAEGDLHTGRFSRGVRHGPGKVTLISGASYASVWTNGIEDERARHVLIAQGGPATVPQLTPGTMQIGLRLDRLLFTPLEAHDAESTLAYTQRSDATKFSIYPDDRALMAAWKGQGSLSIACCDMMKFRPIPMNFRVKNAGNASSDVRKTYLAVSESSADLQPLFVASDLFVPECERSEICTKFMLTNYGWSKPLKVNIDAAFQPAAAGAPELRFSRALVPGKHVIDIEPELLRFGVNVTQLKAWQPNQERGRAGLPCEGKDDAACVAHVRSTGALGRLADHVTMEEGFYLVAKLNAKLSYTWKDHLGTERSYTAPFTVQFPLGLREADVGGEGATPPDKDPSTAYPVELKAGRRNYRIDLPAKGALAPGGDLQIRLLLKTAQSSQHRFRLVIEMADGKVHQSKEVALQTFVSSEWATRKYPSED